jgi:hypothetical protein
MKVLRRSRRLAWPVGCTALTVGVAGVAAAASAPARAGIVFQSHVVASWGDNTDGDLGDGTTDVRPQYGDIKVANDIVQVAAGYNFGLALQSSGTVWAWGDNDRGQLGNGTTISTQVPVKVVGLSHVPQAPVPLGSVRSDTAWVRCRSSARPGWSSGTYRRRAARPSTRRIA